MSAQHFTRIDANTNPLLVGKAAQLLNLPRAHTDQEARILLFFGGQPRPSSRGSSHHAKGDIILIGGTPDGPS